jgi:two-component system response regulator YcbB
MITEAYESGIEFYINKPINVIEVVSVTKRVIESQRNRRMLAQIGNTLNQNVQQPYMASSSKEKIESILAEPGIASEKGAEDLVSMILEAKNTKRFQMSELYSTINKMNSNKVSEKAIEQRTRRMIHTSLVNIATVGIEDFGNYRFEKYASTIFSFPEVKKMMDAIRQNKPLKATINIKQFISGIVVLLERN